MGRNRKNRNRYNNYINGYTDGLDMQKNQPDNGTFRQQYIDNEHLGSESRSTEYKNGPGFIKMGFRENVAKYVCGFVNSQENGKLLIGVNDDGLVTGYSVTHKQEDALRRDVDEAVKDIIPALFPKDYVVRFVPVVDENQQSLGNVMVIEIHVYGGNIQLTDQLYSNKQGVFMRRDGSIQELKAHDIQEWIRRKYQGELEKEKKNRQNLEQEVKQTKNENRQLQQKLTEKSEQMRRREIEEERKTHEVARQTSFISRLTDKNKELQDEVNKLKERKVESNGLTGSDTFREQMNRMENMLTEQIKSNQKKSRVCTIS